MSIAFVAAAPAAFFPVAFVAAFGVGSFGLGFFGLGFFGLGLFGLGFVAARFAPVPGPRRDWPLPAVVRAVAPLAPVVPLDWRELGLFDPFPAAADFAAFFAFGCAERDPLPFEEDERLVDALRRRVVVCAIVLR